MLTWLIIGVLLITSFAYLIWYLKSITAVDSNNHLHSFSDIRQQEITEELDAGRLSYEEAEQLKKDLQTEVALTSQQKSNIGSTYSRSNHFSIQVFVVFVSFSFLGALALYQYLGFNSEVVFTEKVNKGQVTQEDMTSFLSYRANKYQRVQDWYWLAKDYLNKGDYVAAEMAFEKALLKPSEDEQDMLRILVDYSQSVFFANGQKVNQKLESILGRILSMDPNQTNALGLQGIVEFEKRNFKGAILSWRKAILVGVNLAERASLLDGIKRAREMGNISVTDVPNLISHKIQLKITTTGLHNLPPNSLFLVYAKVANQRMPVAIKRILPTQLENVIELTNLDNLMPGMTLKDLSKVDVVVKLANANDQDLTKGREVALLSGAIINSGKILRLSIEL